MYSKKVNDIYVGVNRTNPAINYNHYSIMCLEQDDCSDDGGHQMSQTSKTI